MSEVEERKPGKKVDGQIIALGTTHSPEEISKSLGGIVSAEAIYTRGKALLKSKGWLSAAENEQALIVRMNNILVKLEERYMDLDNAMAQLKILKEIGNRLDKRQAATEADMASFGAEQAIQIGQIIELSLQKALATLRKTHPEIAESELRSAIKLALPEARAEIQSRVVDE